MSENIEKNSGSTNETPNDAKSENFLSNIIDWVKGIFTGHSLTTWIWIVVFLVISLITVYLFYIQYTDEQWLFSVVVNYFVIPINKLNEWGYVIFIIFMGVQGILMPIPSELVLLSSGIIWNVWEGALLGIIGSMFAGILTYYISLKGGRPLAEKMVGKDNIELVDKYIEKYGGLFIVAARAFPFMAFDPISYASGLVKIKARVYIFATFIGSIIRCFFYAWLGSLLLGEGKDVDYLIAHPGEMEQFIADGSARFNTMFIIIIVVVVGSFLLYQFVLVPYLQKKNKTLETELANKTINGTKNEDEVVQSPKELGATSEKPTNG